ncbi:hypothetical protein P7K49_014975 [Saguinus oedipus]|uniref:Uncharacterized protein n=1 Tax=Saguinus oedipus TaxID=9490 RepID=A0ABQ9V7X5_SAGOE|nr:hypothetical protein P7K49_014975 [Saguinus oedipus]
MRCCYECSSELERAEAKRLYMSTKHCSSCILESPYLKSRLMAERKGKNTKMALKQISAVIIAAANPSGEELSEVMQTLSQRLLRHNATGKRGEFRGSSVTR